MSSQNGNSDVLSYPLYFSKQPSVVCIEILNSCVLFRVLGVKACLPDISVGAAEITPMMVEAAKAKLRKETIVNWLCPVSIMKF